MNDRAEERGQSELAEVATVPGGLIDDLEVERNMSGLTLTGFQDTVALPVDTLEEARSAVDRSVETFTDVVLDNESAAAAYDEALSALNQLTPIRTTVDEDEGPRSVDNLRVGIRVYDRYSEVIAAFLDGMTRLVVSFDAGELERGADLIHLTSRQVDATSVLIIRLIFGVLEYGGRLVDDQGDPVDRELVAEIRWLTGDLQRRRTEIRELGTGKYEAATTKALEEAAEPGFEERAEAVLEGEAYSVEGLLDAVSPDPDAGWRGLRLAVEGRLRDF